jgi:hypothetical protein
MNPWYNLFELSEADNNQNKVDLLDFILSVNRLKPKVFWYVSAGSDLNPLYNLSKSELEQPDFFFFNGIGDEFNNLYTSHQNDEYLLENEECRIKITKHIKILQNRNCIPVVYNSQHLAFERQDPSLKGYDGAILQAKIENVNSGEIEYKWIVYFENENINILKKLFLSRANSSMIPLYLCSTCQGVGTGGGNTSIINYLVENIVNQSRWERLKLKYLIHDQEVNLDDFLIDNYIMSIEVVGDYTHNSNYGNYGNNGTYPIYKFIPNRTTQQNR